MLDTSLILKIYYVLSTNEETLRSNKGNDLGSITAV